MDGLATGGPIEPDSVAPVGEGGCNLPLSTSCDCGCRGGCATAANITISLRGTVAAKDDLVRNLREQVLQFNRRNGNGPATA